MSLSKWLALAGAALIVAIAVASLVPAGWQVRLGLPALSAATGVAMAALLADLTIALRRRARIDAAGREA